MALPSEESPLLRRGPRTRLVPSRGRRRGQPERSVTSAQLSGALVVSILERSVKAGLRNVSPLIRDPAFEPFRGRDDFQRLVLRMMDQAFPANPLSD